jgi:hypothetical protein
VFLACTYSVPAVYLRCNFSVNIVNKLFNLSTSLYNEDNRRTHTLKVQYEVAMLPTSSYPAVRDVPCSSVPVFLYTSRTESLFILQLKELAKGSRGGRAVANGFSPPLPSPPLLCSSGRERKQINGVVCKLKRVTSDGETNHCLLRGAMKIEFCNLKKGTQSFLVVSSEDSALCVPFSCSLTLSSGSWAECYGHCARKRAHVPSGTSAFRSLSRCL